MEKKKCIRCDLYSLPTVSLGKKNNNKKATKKHENKFALLVAQQLEENENHKLKHKLKLMESETRNEMRRSSEPQREKIKY